ncbi:MAG: transketolase [Chthoniobacterales bacterium]
MSLNLPVLSRAANIARGLAIDAVHKSSSGHLGLPLGAAEVGAVLFGEVLNFYPADPHWLNRDRFVLSAGHGSMFLYSWLHLAGYDLSIQDVADFRVLDSKTPGHPEFGHTVGVECTTGPLGQGVGNAVGMAVSAKMAAARFNTAEHAIFDHKIVALAGDGCLQEGVAAEASSFAGHFKLDNLILIYDSNDVTLDAMASASQSEDTAKRYEAYGFDVQIVDGHDMEAFLVAFEKARVANGKPHFIIVRTLIAQGIPEVAGTAKGHGEGGAKFADAARKGLDLPAEHFYVDPVVTEFFAARQAVQKEKYDAWQKLFLAWEKTNPALSALLDSGITKSIPANLIDKIPAFKPDSKVATRKAGSDVLQPLAEVLPLLVGGSADLYGSTLNYIDSSKDFTPGNYGGRNIRFGIREHGMTSIMNGIAYHGIFRPSGATFLVFADYCRAAIRLAALSHLPTLYIFTHDSVGVGEDGPTHEPVETVSSLRVIPNLDVIRPADPEETAGAFAAALTRTDGPTLLSLSRQAVPMLNDISVEDRRAGVEKGAYIAIPEKGELTTILLGAGSEVQYAVEAAKQLGDGVRVVSVPCFERFDRQSDEYRESVLPKAIRRRVAIEAGVSDLWFKYVGLDGKVVGIDRFGLSAPGAQVFKVLGITTENLVKTVQSLE